MAIFRVNKNKNYTVMSNYHFKDKKLSLKAKGLLSQMLSLPDDWDYTVAGLCAINKESEGSIKSALKELSDNRYLKITKTQNKQGRFSYIYDIFEQPYSEKLGPENPHVDNPAVENPYVDNPAVENTIQLNTNKLNTNKLNTNNTTTKVVEEEPPKTYGNSEINKLFDEWEKICGFRIDSKIKMNRYACQRLIKSKGLDNVIKVLPYVAESQTDKYAPSINNFIDLSEKWNNLWIWLKKKNMTEAMKYSTIKV